MSITRNYNTGGIAVATFSVCRQSTRLSRVYGYFNSNANPNTKVWLQFFTTTLDQNGNPIAPVGGAVPVDEFLLVPDYEFAELFNSGLTLIPGPIYAALSTTEGTYTAVVGGQVANIWVECEEWEIEPPALTLVGPTGITLLQSVTVWADTLAAPSAPNALYDVVATNLSALAGQMYLCLFAAAPTTGVSIPLKVWPMPLTPTSIGININATGSLLLNFGDALRGGYTPVQQASIIGATNTGINTSACYFAVSNSPTLWTKTSGFAGNACRINARYCTPTV